MTSPTPAPTPALSISCPTNVTVPSPAGAAVVVMFTAPATTGGVGPVQVSCTRTSGSPFTVGATAVLCTATDAASASTSCSFTVTVTAPVPQLLRTRFLAFGDSTTAGEVTTPTGTRLGDGSVNSRLVVIPSASYPTQLLMQLRARYTGQATAFQVINAGSPGEWAEDGAIRLPGVMSSVRPEAVLLLQGANEIGA
ncbi:MAG: HYR domain-containing protein, partial [Acidobacteria bacterium]|nr:HYR domain-containing protein [Acidobacteriota bacterium]